MKKQIFLTILAGIVSISSAFGAITVNVLANTGAGEFTLSDGSSQIPAGSSYRWGAFDLSGFNALSPSQQMDFTTVNGLFTVIGSEVFSASGEITVVNKSITDLQGISPTTKMYAWVTNTADPALATEWGIFTSTNTLWNLPEDNGSLTLSNAFVDTAVIGNVANLSLASIPEPTTYALILSVVGLAVVMRRRMRR